jgi:hypothetical protein
MRKVRNYFHVLLWSVSDPAYYFVLVRRKLSFSFAFFLITLGFTTLVTTIGWRIFVFPTFLQTVAGESKALINQLPANSSFSYANGVLTTQNIPLPFYFKSSTALRDLGVGENAIALSAQDKPLSAAITLTPKTVYFSSVSDQQDPLRYSEIKELQSFTVHREELYTLVKDQSEYVTSMLTTITIAFFTANFLSSLVFGLFMIAFFSLLVQSVGWLLGVRMLYRQAFQWGLHIYPLALLVDQVSLFLAPKSHFPVVNVAYIGMSLLILWYGYRMKHQQYNV